MATKFGSLSYEDIDELCFGYAKRVLRYGFGIEVGNGRVIPEIKYFPQPNALKSPEALLKSYEAISKRILERAINLGVESLQLETELPHIATLDPRLAGEITSMQKELLEKYHEEYRINLGLRITVADVRNFYDVELKEERTNIMLETFSEVSKNGADVVSIESFGGKEVLSQAIVRCDIYGMIFATVILSGRDVASLWKEIKKSVSSGTLLGGDSACAHANSAMVLANGLKRRMIPHIIATIERVLGAIRTLACYEVGATGPGKDCAYENVYIKIITGIPVSMEGKSSACAHSSLVGNIVAAVCDLWSNESIEDVRLFGGYGPEVFTEILHYDCELLNTAIKEGKHKVLRDLLIKSDKFRDPQAFILSPDVAFEICKVLIQYDSDYIRAIEASKLVCKLLKGYSTELKIPRVELKYLEKVEAMLEKITPSESKFIEQMVEIYKKYCPKFNPKCYEI